MSKHESSISGFCIHCGVDFLELDSMECPNIERKQ